MPFITISGFPMPLDFEVKLSPLEFATKKRDTFLVFELFG